VGVHVSDDTVHNSVDGVLGGEGGHVGEEEVFE